MHSHSVASDSLLAALRWRYATKKFDPSRKIASADWKTLEEALVLSPSAFGLQPWKFLVITDQATKEALVPASWGQRQVADCSHLVVFAYKKDLGMDFIEKNLQRIAEVRGVPVESLEGYRKVIAGTVIDGPAHDQIAAWNQRQTYLAFGSFMTCAALLGIDTCPMEGLVPSKYDEILGLPERGLMTGAACPAGYRAADDRYASLPKVRFEAREVFEYI
ncbi:MAG: NAD(P)H-dependent oxidoreductase [Chthoniobacteraceae bacterium]|nr:NAD(P)H-dependent oxidoreductase [Chthoniobacteraceae bacterium]